MRHSTRINKFIFFCVVYLLASTAIFFSSRSFADAPVAPQKISGSSELASLLGGLALILVLIYGLSWFVKRFMQGGFLQNSAIKMVASLPLGTRERLALIQVGDKQLLLGITATQINCLHTFDEPIQLADEKTSIVASDFSQKLMNILQQKNLLDSKSGLNNKNTSNKNAGE